MSDKAAKLLAGAIFTLAVVYLMTHIHKGIAIGAFGGTYVIYNTITGTSCLARCFD